MPSPFKPGDIVRLKSGGPNMTVDKSGTDSFGRERVWVEWFDENKKTSRDTFGPDSLVLYE
jgi:uncharacterized protein YodC (DUF2158 family)